MSRTIPALFDEAILGDPEKERLDYFQRKTVAHPHLVNSLELAKDNIEFGADHEIVAIVGPAEVGTTTLARNLHKHYKEKWPVMQQLEAAEAMVCSIGVGAPNSAGRLDVNYWKRLLQEILVKAGDTLYDKKLYVPPTHFQLQPFAPYLPAIKQDIDILMSSVVRMLDFRRTKVLIINQAERLFPENDRAGCIRSQQILADLAAQSDTRIVLVANYELLKTTCVRGDWLQRRNVVHLRRYDWQSENDLKDFNSTLDQLLGNIPSRQRLKKLSEQGAWSFYVNSVGCIGTLKKTLMMATSHSFRTGEEMTESFILRFGQPNTTAASHAEQAKMGERLLMDIDQKEVERILDPNWMPGTGSKMAGRTGHPTSAVAPARGRKSSFGQRIGERTPTRDPVGGIHAKRA